MDSNSSTKHKMHNLHGVTLGKRLLLSSHVLTTQQLPDRLLVHECAHVGTTESTKERCGLCKEPSNIHQPRNQFTPKHSLLVEADNVPTISILKSFPQIDHTFPLEPFRYQEKFP